MKTLIATTAIALAAAGSAVAMTDTGNLSAHERFQLEVASGVEIGAVTGGEAARLRWGDIDADRSECRIPRSFCRGTPSAPWTACTAPHRSPWPAPGSGCMPSR